MVSNLTDTSSVTLRQSNIWVFDPACNFHLAWDSDYFQSLELHDDRMRAANATPLVIQGIGKAGTVPNDPAKRIAPAVLFLVSWLLAFHADHVHSVRSRLR